jgi:hypothetical protein
MEAQMKGNDMPRTKKAVKKPSVEKKGKNVNVHLSPEATENLEFMLDNTSASNNKQVLELALAMCRQIHETARKHLF